MSCFLCRSFVLLSALLIASPVLAQMPGGGPPAVGTMMASRQTITET